MAKVRQSKTKPEEAVAAALRKLGVRYRRNLKSLAGKPDFSNRSKGWVVQVHGCFWHQHNCKRGTMPAHNREEWEAKFAANKARDRLVDEALRGRGFRVLTIWECEAKDSARLKKMLSAHLG